MVQRRTKRRSKRRTKKRRVSTKSVGLVYYKMMKCKYCKMFERELWKKIVEFCNKKGIQTHIVVRELNPELIPKRIKTFPSLVKYDNNNKMIIFKGERTLNNLIKFLYINIYNETNKKNKADQNEKQKSRKKKK